MKTTYLAACLLLGCMLSGSCKDDSASDPVFGEKEIPYIYTNYPATLAAGTDEPLDYTMLVSPADGSVAVKWMLDDEVISDSTRLTYTITRAGVYRLRFEAERNGLRNFREYTLTISETN